MPRKKRGPVESTFVFWSDLGKKGKVKTKTTAITIRRNSQRRRNSLATESHFLVRTRTPLADSELVKLCYIELANKQLVCPVSNLYFDLLGNWPSYRAHRQSAFLLPTRS